MVEETAANPAVESEAAPEAYPGMVDLDAEAKAPAGEVEEPQEVEGEGSDPEEDANPEPEDEAGPELIEAEFEGQTYQVPPEIKDALLREADYRRKTMEVAEERKAAVAEREQAQALANRTNDEFKAHVAKAQIETALAEYDQVDWEAWESTDPVAAMGGWRQFQTLKDQHNQVEQFASALEAERIRATQQAEQETANRQRQVLSQVTRELKLGKDDLAQMDEVAKLIGIPDEAIRSIDQAWMIKALNLAAKGMAYSKRQSAAAKMRTVAAVKPATQVGQAASATPDPDSMSMAEYVAARRAGKI